MVEDKNLVSIGHGRQAVGDDERRPSAAQSVEGAFDFAFGLRIEGAGGLIQYENWGLLENGAGNGNALALAARQCGTSFARKVSVAPRFAHDEGVRLGETCGLLDLGVAGIWAANSNVLGDAAIEQARVLEHHRYGTAERV